MAENSGSEYSPTSTYGRFQVGKEGFLNYAIQFNVGSKLLTDAQANHVSEIGKEFAVMMAEKYTKGQREHGGNLWDQTEDQLLDNAILEAIDQVVYLFTIRRKRRAAAANGSENSNDSL